MSVLNILFSILIAFVAVIVAYQLVYRVLRWVSRKRQARRSALEETVLIRMLVPKEDEKASVKGPIVMEQIFNTLAGVRQPIGFFARVFGGKSQPAMSFEIAHLEGQIFFFARVPKTFQRLMEGQIYAQYPEVEMEVVEDYISAVAEKSEIRNSESQTPSNGHHSKSKTLSLQQQTENLGAYESFQSVRLGQICIAEMGYSDCFLWPFKTYDFFVDKDDKTQVDTLSSLTSAMSKLNHEEDQAWFQLVIRPEERLWQKYATEAYKTLKAGYFNRWGWSLARFTKWYCSPFYWHHWLVKVPTRWFFKLVWTVFGLLKPVDDPSLVEKQEVGFSFWEIPNKKLKKMSFQTSVRLGYLSRSTDVAGARIKVQEMSSSFNQFKWPEVNGLEIKVMGCTDSAQGEALYQRMKDRVVEPGMNFGVDELATIYHLPMWNLETPNIAWVRAKRLEPPAELPTTKDFDDLTLLGKTNFRGVHKEFGIKEDDRRRHMYIIGKTGMGKSTVLENMIYDDIQKGRGVAVVDPHGELADKVTAMIPQHRINDAVIFDPSDSHFPVSFNMLEVKSPEHRPLVASGLVGVFKKMYAESWGPRLEYILRNCILALTEYEGATLLGIPRLLVDPIYREKVVERITDPVVRSFWVDEFANMSDKMRTEAISPIQNKVGQFLSSPVIRNILGQPKSSIDIRHAMDTKKIFVVNLSKGKIGEDNSSLLGSMLITKFQLDAMSRADIAPEDRTDFYLYVDEFQNFATDSFATILSEARKYKLNLVMANQYVQQMEEEVMYAVFGNVGTLITFQVGFDDAEYFSKQFGEVVTPSDIISMQKYTAYIRLLVDNMPTKVFSATMSPPVDVDMDSPTRYKVLKASRERYGNEKLQVEDKIKRWSEQMIAPEMKKALLAKGSGLSGVRWRYDRNKKEFEELLNSAGKKFQELKREDFEKYGVQDAANEYVYLVPEEGWLIYSRVDTQGNCFNKKENKILFQKYDEKDLKKHEFVQETEKGPGWQLGVNKVIGGGFRNPKNQEEMEGVFSDSGFQWELVDRKQFGGFGLEKAINELVYRLKKDSHEWVVISALDPQGGCFTRNPDQMIRIGLGKVTGFEELKVLKKSLEWVRELTQVVKEL
ncbi:MAG: type IV secretion system DNA-binding domain-containing protein [bacterium]|nr:type IV secretion system DNA-binding domain-containing protein [bacterium]